MSTPIERPAAPPPAPPVSRPPLPNAGTNGVAFTLTAVVAFLLA